MRDSYFNSCVERLSKYKNKILIIQKLKDIIKSILWDNFSENKIYKMIYYLKSKWYLYSIKKDLILIKNPNDTIDESSILEKFYREILSSHVVYYCKNNRYIWWIKALELNTENYEIPDEIDVFNDSKVSLEVVLFEKKVLFKKYKHKSESIWSKFKKFTKKIKISNKKFNIANVELSILESLHSPSLIQKWYINELIKKIIRKNKKKLDLTIFEQIIKTSKHQSSINRLYDISKSVDPIFAQQILNIIKKYSFLISIK